MVAGRHVPYHRYTYFLVAFQETFGTEGIDHVVFQVPGARQFEGNVRMQVEQARQHPFSLGIDFPCILRQRVRFAQGDYAAFIDENAGVESRFGPGAVNQGTSGYPIRCCNRVTTKQQ